MPQYWSPDARCAYCPATSNTTHDPECMHNGVYDEDGRLIPFIPETQQLTLEFPV